LLCCDSGNEYPDESKFEDQPFSFDYIEYWNIRQASNGI
jgi:hypothetical protein